MEDGIMQVVQTALRGLSLRQQAISNNLANIDTPGFKGSDVSFEDQLQRALEGGPVLPVARTHASHITLQSAANLASVAPQEVPLPGSRLRNDGNNVDVDVEMSRLAETSTSYNALIEAMNMKLSLLRSVITEGRR